MSKLFKDWDKVDETCPNCNQITKRQRGITKQNLKRLIKPKWDVNEFTIMFFLLFFIILALLYKAETQDCRNWMGNMTSSEDKESCIQNCDMQCSNKCTQMYLHKPINLSNVNFSGAK